MAFASDREKCAHLLRRFGLGASEAELDYYSKDGVQGAIDKLLNYEDVEEGFSLEVTAMPSGNKLVNMPGVVAWWTLRMLITRRPLQEKMTLFWHDHFATSASKVNAPLTMHGQNEILRKNATGKFRTLLGEVSKDPAMLFWLDNQENIKGKPNENFAREVMELFTLGIGNYSEKDVQESARAFTGWSIQRLTREDALLKRKQADFAFRPLRHDAGDKVVLGKSGALDGDAVLDLLCEQPRTAEYLTHKIWEWFVYPEPSAATVAKYTKVFSDSSLDIKALLRAIMASEEFYSAKAQRAVVKNPVDFCIVTMRQLGVGEGLKRALDGAGTEELPRGAIAPAFATSQAMRSMGMWLLYPPDVAGWDGGQSWITSATMVERMKWSEKLFSGRYPAYAFFSGDPTPKGVVDKLVSALDAPIKKEKLPSLVEAAEKASGGEITQRNAGQVAIQVSRLIFASPEFQFA